MSLTLSSVVGRPLTPAEIDANFLFVDLEATTQKNQADSSATAAGTSAAQALSAAGGAASSAAAQAVANVMAALGAALTNTTPVLCVTTAGQSQIDGRGELNGNTERGLPNTLMYSKANKLVQAYEPSGDTTSQAYPPNLPGDIVPGAPGHSALTKMAKLVAAASGLRVAFAPCSVGSTSMWTWLPGASNATLPGVGSRTDTTTLYGAMLVRTQQMLALCGKAAIDFLCWGQGEAEVSNPAMVPSLFHQLVYEFRTDFGPLLPIFYFGVGNTGSGVQTTADNNLLVAEGYRQCEDTYGSNALTTFNATVNRYKPANIVINASTVTPKNANATNTISAATINGDASAIQMVWDGTATLGWSVGGLTNGQSYALLLDMDTSGSGQVKVTSNAAQVAGSSFYSVGPARLQIPFVANGTTVEVYRASSGQTGNLKMRATLLVLAANEATPIMGTHMISTYDLPRYDITHYDQAGVKELGRRYALAVRQYFLQDTAVDGTGPRLVSTRYITSAGASDRHYVTVRFDRPIVQDLTNWNFGTQLLFRFYSSGSEVTPIAIMPTGDQTVITFQFTDPFPADPGGGVYAGTVTYGDRLGPALHTWQSGVVYGQASNLPTPMFGRQNIAA